VLPRRHAAAFDGEVDRGDLARCLGEATRRVAGALGDPAYNVVLHHAPRGEERVASYHWHVEILPRTTGIAGFELASGIFVNTVGPSEAARALRAVRF
jgi:UDPglucose--hexose-1-phosphate uridylyltransferase